MENDIRKIMSALFEIKAEDISDIHNSKSLQSWDSLQHIHLVTALEEHFGIIFPEDRIQHLTCLSAIMREITKLEENK